MVFAAPGPRAQGPTAQGPGALGHREGPREAKGGPREGPGEPREGPGKAQGPGRAQGGPGAVRVWLVNFMMKLTILGPEAPRGLFWGGVGPN